MNDPLGVVLLIGIGVFAILVGVFGMRRGKVVAIFELKQSEQPALFWYGIVFQCGLGAVCLFLGIAKLFGWTP